MPTIELIVRHSDLDTSGCVTVDIGRNIHTTQVIVDEITFIPAITTDSALNDLERSFTPDATQGTHIALLSTDWMERIVGNQTGVTTPKGSVVIPLGHWRRERDVAVAPSPDNPGDLTYRSRPMRVMKVPTKFIPRVFRLAILSPAHIPYQPLNIEGNPPATGGTLTHTDWTFIFKMQYEEDVAIF